MLNNKGFSLIETALVMLVLSATVFAFINVMNIQAQKAALKNYSKDLTNTYQTFLDAFIRYAQKQNPTTSTTYTCTTIKADPDKFLPDSFLCIDNLGQSLEGRVSFKGTSVYGYFVYGNPGGANVSNYLNAFSIKTFTQLINLFIQMTGDLDNTSKKFLVIQNKTNIYQINSTNYVTATTADIFGGDTYLSSLPTFSFAGQQYTVGLWSLAQTQSSSGGGTLHVVKFTSSGTWQVPGGVNVIWATGTAAGGGGGGAFKYGEDYYGGGGGGSGSACINAPLTVVPGETLTITIGSGGLGGRGNSSGDYNATAGGDGGNTIISGSVSGTLLTLFGGKGGYSRRLGGYGGPGGGPGGGPSVVSGNPGNPGGNGSYFLTGASGGGGSGGGDSGRGGFFLGRYFGGAGGGSCGGGGGGASLYGPGGDGGAPNSCGQPVGIYGAGGGGAGCYCIAGTGGKGGDGYLEILYYQ